MQAVYGRYRQARRPDKGRILTEFCHVVGCHRKSAIRLLNGPAPGAARPPRRRAPRYAAATIEALRGNPEGIEPENFRAESMFNPLCPGAKI